MQYKLEKKDGFSNQKGSTLKKNYLFSVGAINKIGFLMKHLFKSEKKWTLKIQKSKIVGLVLNQSPISAVFPIVRFARDQKTALTGESL